MVEKFSSIFTPRDSIKCIPIIKKLYFQLLDTPYPAVSAPTRQLLNLILGNVNSQFMKECGIPVVSANTKQLVKDILGIMYSLFMKEWFILVICVTTSNFPMDTPVS